MWLISDLHCNKYCWCCTNWTMKMIFLFGKESYVHWNLSSVKHSSVCLFLYVSFNGILQWNLFKPKTCLNQTHFTVLSTKCLCNFSLCKPSTCLNWANYSVPKGFGLDRFHCTIKINKNRTLDFPLIFN